MLRGGIARAAAAGLSSASVRERVARFLFYDPRVKLSRAERRSPGRRKERGGRHREGAGKRLRGGRRIQKDDYEHTHDCARPAHTWAYNDPLFVKLFPAETTEAQVVANFIVARSRPRSAVYTLRQNNPRMS